MWRVAGHDGKDATITSMKYMHCKLRRQCDKIDKSRIDAECDTGVVHHGRYKVRGDGKHGMTANIQSQYAALAFVCGRRWQ